MKQKLKKLVNLGILAFGVSLIVISCSKDSMEIQLTEIQKLQNNFTLKEFNNSYVKENIEIEWDNFKMDTTNNILTYEFNTISKSNGTLTNGKQQIFSKYNLLVTKSNDNHWSYELIKFLTINSKSINTVSYFSLSNFSGTLLHYNLEGENIATKAFNEGILINQIPKDTINREKTNINNTLARLAPIEGSSGEFVRVCTENYTDWYHVYNGVAEYTHSIYEGESCDYFWVDYGTTGASGSGLNTNFHNHYDGTNTPHKRNGNTYNHDNELILIEDEIQVFDSPDHPILNMEEYLECFNNSQGAKITIYVDQPIANSDTPFATFGDKAGHSFVSISQNDITLVWGLYPDGNATPFDPNHPYSFGNDQGHEFDVSISFTINRYNLENIIDNAINYTKNYDLNTNNCTDYMINLAQLSGITLSDPQSTWTNGGGSNPGAFGEALRTMNLPSGMTRNDDGGNAPLNNSNCN